MDRRKQGFRIPRDVETFTKMTYKKYKKKFSDNFSKKKDNKKAYYNYMINCLPAVIILLTKYSNVREVMEIKDEIYERMFGDDELLARIKKCLEKDPKSIENAEFFPIVIWDAMKVAAAWNEETGSKYDMSDIIEISTIVMEKKIKKLTKAGISKDLAFDCLSIIPTSKALEGKQAFRLRILMNMLYNRSKNDEEIKFDVIAKYVVTEEFYPALITTLLLERKSDYAGFEDKQKEFFNSVTDWALTALNDMEKTQIREILKAYFGRRKADKEQGKDSNRRYFLSALPTGDDFKNIIKVIDKMKESDPSIEEFL